MQPGMSVWPGDTPFESGFTIERGEQGSVVTVGKVVMSTHTGTHADAPTHYSQASQPVDKMPLLHFVGPCLVIKTSTCEGLSPGWIASELSSFDLGEAPRVLVRSPMSDVAGDSWADEIPFFLPETVHWLADQGVVLIGTDAPSIDPVDSKTLDAHHAIHARGVANLENLWLADVPPGRYHLTALPLKLVGMDASPVRAVLSI